MAKETTRKVLVPASEAESIKANLQRVQDELARVRDKAKEEAEALDRIRGMIDLRYLNDLLSAIEELEDRIKAMERDSEAETLRQSLEQEQQRLAKLWDAFKTQEDELRSAMNDRDALLDRLEEIEQDIKQLGSTSQAKAKIAYLDKENKRLAEQLAKTADRQQDFRSKFEDEQARLAKLFKVYEDTTAELEKYHEQETEWHAWRQKHWDDLPETVRKAGDKIQKKYK
jgi:chromosome segregation ATPase